MPTSGGMSEDGKRMCNDGPILDVNGKPYDPSMEYIKVFGPHGAMLQPTGKKKRKQKMYVGFWSEMTLLSVVSVVAGGIGVLAAAYNIGYL